MNKDDVLHVFQNFFPGKTVTVNYDDNCVVGMDQGYVNGNPLLYGNITYNRVRVDIQDFPSQYVSIDESIMQMGNKPLRDWVSARVAVIIPSYDLNELASRKAAAEAPGAPQSAIDAYNNMLNDLATQSGYTTTQILAML